MGIIKILKVIIVLLILFLLLIYIHNFWYFDNTQTYFNEILVQESIDNRFKVYVVEERIKSNLSNFDKFTKNIIFLEDLKSNYKIKYLETEHGGERRKTNYGQTYQNININF